VGGFSFDAGFPDIRNNFYGFETDPLMPNRVWVFAQFEGTNTGPLPFGGEPTGRRVVTCPQMTSLVFDDEGKVARYNIGYPLDRTTGNSGGLGGVYGILYGLGRALPFPEAQPWTPSKRYRLFQWIARATGRG